MLRTFKALTTITVWLLFGFGCLGILVAIPIPRFYAGQVRYLPLGLASLFLSVVAMKIRLSME